MAVNLGNKLIPYKYRPRRVFGHLIGPKVLTVSVPKAGTHLLRQTLSLFPMLRLGGDLTIPREKIIPNLEYLKRGQVVSMHHSPWPEIIDYIINNNIKVLFIYRDPRDICVSYLYWVWDIDSKNPHREFLATLPDDDARLLAVIKGDALKYKMSGMADINTIMENRLIWRSFPFCLTLKFEDLVGPKGQGSSEAQKREILRIEKHLGVTLTQNDINFILENMYSKTTATFRRGKIGDWTNHFKPIHKDTFKELTRNLLIDLGYEIDSNW